MCIHTSVARPLDATVTKINPNNSTVEFGNGRIIEYKTLVIDQGLQPAFEKIEGFTEALHNPTAPVFSSIESNDSRKYFKGFPLFT